MVNVVVTVGYLSDCYHCLVVIAGDLSDCYHRMGLYLAASSAASPFVRVLRRAVQAGG